MNLFKKIFGTKTTKSGNNLQSSTKELIERDWVQVDVLLKQKGPSQLRQGLIVADKTLDNALKDLVSGENMGERLKAAKDLFDYQTYDKLWKAHKMRNSLVHETGYEPPHHMVTKGIEDIRMGLKKLKLNI